MKVLVNEYNLGIRRTRIVSYSSMTDEMAQAGRRVLPGGDRHM